jgi:hypothetical protein
MAASLAVANKRALPLKLGSHEETTDADGGPNAEPSEIPGPVLQELRYAARLLIDVTTSGWPAIRPESPDA